MSVTDLQMLLCLGMKLGCNQSPVGSVVCQSRDRLMGNLVLCDDTDSTH